MLLLLTRVVLVLEAHVLVGVLIACVLDAADVARSGALLFVLITFCFLLMLKKFYVSTYCA